MKIRVLDEGTIDKIAAGEVVEKPASVVKELVENAMDAGADAITVEIKEGGISLIRVTDNGEGIAAGEVPRAFLRHATSKIRAAEDLEHLVSLGFRGEALSSICAVARVEMVTKAAHALTGLRYLIQGGAQVESQEVGAPQGTTVLVRDLFYNVPARKKFLKTPQTEGGYVTELLEHLALSHPEISFKFVLNGQVKFHTNGGGDLREILYRIYGRQIARELVPIDREREGKRLFGLLGTPSIGRANRNFENYFINGRFIKSPVIAKAAEEAYGPYLMQHRYPFFALHLSLPPDCLDVNVHPSKMEVRFHEPGAVSDFVYEAIRDTLSKREMLRQVTLEDPSPKKEQQKAEYVPEPFETEARKLQSGGETDFLQGGEQGGSGQAHDTATPPAPAPARVAEEPPFGARLFGGLPCAGEKGERPDNVIKKDAHILVEKPVQMNFFEEKLLSPNLRSQYRILGQVFGTYWLVELSDKLLIIDQHAAHEKVKYESLCHQIQAGSVPCQQMNPPAILTLSGREEAVYRQYEAYFEKMGFEIEPFGGSEYAIRGVPGDLFGRSPQQLLREVLDELTEGPIHGEPQAITEKLASMACKAAVKGNHAMGAQEAEALTDALLALENPYHCPHGRPTMIVMRKYELEKKFSRIV